MTLQCEECGQPYRVSPSRVGSRWCSWDCRVASGAHRQFARKERVRECRHCGSVITSKPSKRNQYCSHACYSAAAVGTRRVRVCRECGYCGAAFEKRPSEVRSGRGKFCSKQCAALGRPVARRSVIADEAITRWAQAATVEFRTEVRVDRWSIDLAVGRLAIELDGEYWHSLPDMVAKDARKDAALRAYGWSVHRIVMTKDDTPATVAERIAAVVDRHTEKVA